MEEITLDETETVTLRGTKSKRASILKQRTPLQVIEPNPRRVSFTVKQTKEFHSTEAPFVLGSSYEETFQSDSPKSSQESHFTMKTVHSSTTETYSDRSNEANTVFCHEELLNTTHFVNVDHFEDSENEYEGRMSIDIQQTETQYYDLGIEEIKQSRHESINWNKQMENVENLTPELLNHFMKRQKTQTSQILYQPRNKTLHGQEAEKAVNISSDDTCNIKAKVWQHHSSETFLECSLPSSHIVRNEGIWNNELMPCGLNRRENKEFVRGDAPLTELHKDTVHKNNDKLKMDADMDFTDVIHINRIGSGSHTSHVDNATNLTNRIFSRGTNSNSDGAQGCGDLDESEIEFTGSVSHTFHINNAVDLTKGIFNREINSNSDEAQGSDDLDESEIEFTNTVGHIAVSESEDTLSKILEMKALESDSSSISDLSNTQSTATKWRHKINAHHLQPSNATMQSVANLASAVDSNKIHIMGATTLKEKNCILEKSDAMDSRINKMNETNSKSITNISNAGCIELTNTSWQNLASDFSQSSQIENINVKVYKSAAEISDSSRLELADAIRCNTSTKHINDSHLKLTNTVCKPILLTHNISRNMQVNNDSANDSQLEFTDVIHCKPVATVSDSCIEFTNVADFKIPDDSGQELTEVGGYGVDANLYKINLEYKNNSGKLNSSEEVECGSHIVHKNLTEGTNLKPVSDHRQEQPSKCVSYNSLADAATGVSLEFTNVNCLPNLESCNDSNLEFTNVASYKPAEIAGISFSKERQCHDSEQTEECSLEFSGLKSSHSSLEFTNIVKHKSFIEHSDNSGLEFTNITRQNQLRKNTESNQQISDIMQNLHMKDFDHSQLEFTNITGQKLLAKNSDVSQLGITDINGQNQEFTQFTVQNVPANTSDSSQLEFTNTGQKLPAEDSRNSQLEFTNIVSLKQAAKVTNVSQMEITDVISHKPATNSDVSQLEFTNVIMQKPSSKSFDGSQLELSNHKRQNLPVKDADNTNSTMQKLLAEDSVDSQLEVTDIAKHKQAAEHIDVSQLEIANIAGQKLFTRDTEISQLDITNITTQKLRAKESDDSHLEFINNTRQNLLVKNSADSNNTSDKSFAKDSDIHSEVTNIIIEKLSAEESDGSHLEFTDNTRQTMHKDDSGNCMDFTNKTKQQLLEKDFDDSQLQFTSITRPRLPDQFSDIGQNLEFTNSIGNNTATKDSNGSQLEFIGASESIPSVKHSVDVELEFSTCKHATNVSDDMNCSKEAEHTLDCLKIPNEFKSAAFKENKVEENYDQTDNQILSLNVNSFEPTSEICDESFINKETVNNASNHNVDELVVINSEVSRKMLSHPEADISNKSINSYRSQLELTEVAPIKPTANISIKLNCNKTREELNQFSVRATDGSQLELTNVTGVKPMAESCESTTAIFGAESAKAVEEVKCIESSVVMDMTDAMQCRRNPTSQMMLADTESQSEYSAKCPYAEREENVDMSIDMTKLNSNFSANRKRNINFMSCNHSNDCELECSNMKYLRSPERADAQVTTEKKTEICEITSNFSASRKRNKNDVSCNRSNDCELECSNIKHFRSAERADAQVTTEKKTEICEITSNFSASRKRNKNDVSCNRSNDCELECSNIKHFRSAERADAQVTTGNKTEICEITCYNSFIEEHLELKKSSPQHMDVTKPQDVSSGQTDVTNTVHSGTIKNSAGCTSLTLGLSNMNLYECRNNESMEFTNKQNYVSRLSGSLEFTACVKDVNAVSKDNLFQEKLQMLSSPLGSEIDNSEQKISVGSDLSQFDTTVSIHQDDLDVTESNISPNTEVIRNDSYRAEYLPLTANRMQKKMQAAQNLLNVTIVSDEAFLFESCTGTFVGKRRSSKQDDKTHSSSPENATNKIREEVKENQKQNIENKHTKDIDLREPERMLLVDELITLNNESSRSDEREDEAGDNLMKVILNADRSLFNLSTASPGTLLSCTAKSPSKIHLVEEIHPNLEKNKGSMLSNEPEMMNEVEGNFVDGQLPKINLLNQPSSVSEAKMEMCNLSVNMDLLSVSDKDVSSIEQAEEPMFFSNNSRETKEKVPDIEESGKEKKVVHLPNVTLTYMELYCRDSLLHDKTEEFKVAAVSNERQSCVAVVQKPLSLEEWLRSRKQEWDVKELSDTQWSFLFLYKSLGLIFKLDAANDKDGMKYISDIFLESYLAKTSAPETHFVHHILLKKLSPQNLKTKFKVTADVPELMNMIYNAVAEMKLFLKDFFFMETCKLMEMKDNRVSFKMSDMQIHSVFRVSVDLNNWENIRPEDVTVEDLMGTINKKEVQSLVNAVPKGPTFLSEYVDIIREYISVLRKK